jgi:GT2 family glycosyltransferase
MTASKTRLKNPLISVLCRTINRHTLSDTLSSVNRQTWANLELVLIDATGRGLELPIAMRGSIKLKIISTGDALDRPTAANCGLENASGDYLLFLDDDDWIAEDHISSLVAAAQANPNIAVVYSHTIKTLPDGTPTGEVIAQAFDRDLLRKGNYIPIHAAMFARQLITDGCVFDTNFAMYEDWDFWLQCATKSDFLLTPHLGAFYRGGGDSGITLDRHHELYSEGHPVADARAQLFHKWRSSWTGQDWNTLLGLTDQTAAVEILHNDLTQAHQKLHATQTEMERFSQQTVQLSNLLSDTQAELAELRSNFDRELAQYRELQRVFEQNQRDHLTLTGLFRQQEIAFHQQQQELQTLQEAHRNLADLQRNTVDTLAARELELDALQSAHIQLNVAHEQLDQAVREILDSFSWRVMAPYRFLRMRLNRLITNTLGPLKRTQKVSLDTIVPKNKAQSQQVAAGIVLPNAELMTFSMPITIQGWAWASGTVKTLDLWLDNQLMQAVPPPDPALSKEDAQRIGFALELEPALLTPGKHLLSLRLTASDGSQCEAQRQFIWQRSDLLYQHWFAAHQHQRVAQAMPETVVAPVSSADSKLIIVINCIYPKAAERDLVNTTLASLASQNSKSWRLLILTQENDAAALVNLCVSAGIDPAVISVADSLDQLPCCSSSWLVPVNPGDVLESDCLSKFGEAATGDIRLIYSDHDRIDAQGKRSDPWFTFSWSPDLLLECNYTGGVIGLRCDELAASLTDRINLQSGVWRYQLLLERCLHLDLPQVTRLPYVLWATREDCPQNPDAETQAVRDLLRAQCPEAVMRYCAARHRNIIDWPLARAPRVSVIIPTTGNMRFLKPCLDTLANTDYPDLEIVILDNSRGRYPDGIEYARQTGAMVIECNEAFNWSRLNNRGVDACTGEILLFLNDDIEVMHPDWLTAMTRLAIRPGVGTVGCLLLYPNGAIQHAGVFLVDHGGGARHLFHKQLPGDGIYKRLDNRVREVSANTGACLMIARDRFERLGRFDETLSIVGNDIDLCLRCLEAGLRNLWTPDSRLVHLESVSRQNKPIGKDETAMWERWEHRFKGGDPWFNPALSLTREDMTLADLPSAPPPVAQAPAQQTEAFGVNLIAYIRASMGVGEAARGNAAALQASALPFGVINYEQGNPSRMDNLRWQHKETNKAEYLVNLIHINADHTPGVMQNLGRAVFKNRYNIGFWAWEMPEFPDRWLGSFDLLDEVWVPSTYVNQAIAAKSPIPVVTIPHVIAIDELGAHQYSRAWFGIADDTFVFVSMFDTHSVAQRKNPFGAIRAFQKAFSAADHSVLLLIKINNADDASLKVLSECVADYQNIRLMQQHFDRAQIDSLINCCNCYVSLHHAEGFGLGPAEAMAMGKVALLTNWSGNTEYMRSDNCVPVNYRLQTLGSDYGPYEAHQYWAVPDIEHAAAEMQSLVANPDRVLLLGENARKTIAQEFSPRAIGERMRRRLDSIRRFRS